MPFTRDQLEDWLTAVEAKACESAGIKPGDLFKALGEVYDSLIVRGEPVMSEDPLAVEAARGVKRRRLFSRYEQAPDAPAVDPDNGLALFRQPFAENSPWRVYPVSPTLSDPGVIPPIFAGQSIVEQGAYTTGCFHGLAAYADKTVVGRASYNAGLQFGDDPDGAIRASAVIEHWPPESYDLGAGSQDGHLCIIDPSTMRMYSLYRAIITGGIPYADIITWSPVGGRGYGDATHWQQGARAGMSPALAGMIRLHEVTGDGSGEYEHPLSIGLDYTGMSSAIAHAFPAVNHDFDAPGANTNSFRVCEGSLLMLAPDYPEFSGNAEINKVIRCLKKYGGRVTDRTGGIIMTIYKENGTPSLEITSNLFTYAADVAALNTIAGDLCLVEKVAGWKRAIDDVNIGELPTAFNLLSMKGDYTNGAVYDTYQQAVILPAGPANTFTSTTIGGLRGGANTGFGPEYADVNLVTFHGPGATGKIEVTDGVGNVLRDTGFLADGETANVTFAVNELQNRVLRHEGSPIDIPCWFDVRDTSKPTVVSITLEDSDPSSYVVTCSKRVWGIAPATTVFGANLGKVVDAINFPMDLGGESCGSYTFKVHCTSAFLHGNVATLDYTKSGTLDIHDAQGNKLDNFTAHAVTNNLSVDVTPPHFLSAVVTEANPDRVLFTMDEALAGTLAAAAAFGVTLGGRTVLSRTPVDSTHFYITISSRIWYGQSMTYSYTQPVSNKLQDASGNLTANVVATVVTNNTTEYLPSFPQLTNLNAGSPAMIETGDGTVGRSYAGTAGQDTAATASDATIAIGDLGYFEIQLAGHAIDASNYTVLYVYDKLGVEPSWGIGAAASGLFSQLAGVFRGTYFTGAGVPPAAGLWLRGEKVDLGGGSFGCHLKWSNDNKATWHILDGDVVNDTEWDCEIYVHGAVRCATLTGGNLT
jgi:hypothetical protein